MRTISVVGIRAVNRGNLRAFVDVVIDGITLRDFKIIEAQNGKRPWVGLPQRQWTDGSGERYYSPLVDLEPQLKQQVIDKILAAWRDFREGGNNYEREKER